MKYQFSDILLTSWDCGEIHLKSVACSVFSMQNHVYAVGGNDGVASLSSVERYHPHLDKWVEVKEMGQRRAGNGVSELHGCLYVVGEYTLSLIQSVKVRDDKCHGMIQ